MCGIAGILDWEGRAEATPMEAMIATLAHRGPDHQAIVERPKIVLGHTRLAIIDLDPASNQPMSLEEAGLWIVFNGEIYDFRELRRELEQAGARFRTAGDTEVILHAYAHWGLDAVKRFNGMFAFGLWDERNERLILARDRVGKKPLYFQRFGDGSVIFASELKAMRQHPRVSRDINPVALGQYLGLNHTLTNACILRGVEKLPPAHYTVIERGRDPKLVEYWDLSYHYRNKRTGLTEEAAAEELTSLIDDAVRTRMISDVPLGAFLSGGVDSSTVVAAMRDVHPLTKTKTFSIGFREPTYSELPEASAAASRFDTDHHEKIVDAKMAELLPRLVWHADEPFADTSMIPLYYLAEHARENVTVCLSGDGGDEVFGGYETYVADQLHRLFRWIPAPLTRGAARLVDRFVPVSFEKVSLDFKLRQFLAAQAEEFSHAHLAWRRIFPEAEMRELLNADAAESVFEKDLCDGIRPHFERVAECHYLDQAMYLDIKTFLADDILVKVDRATMAHSLEARAPFLDHRIMEFSASLPATWKVRWLQKKRILKRSQRSRLPREILERKKKGFNAPVNHWLDGSFGDLVYEAATNKAMQNWIHPSAVDRLWTQHRQRERDNSYRMFGLGCLGLWLEGC